MLIQDSLINGTFDAFLERQLPDGKTVHPRELATLVHRESTAIAADLTEICLRRGENVIVQGTLAWDEQPRVLLTSFNASEYQELIIVDVEVDLSTALDRSIERWWVGRNDPFDALGGRFVPSSVIKDLYLPDGSTRCRANAEVMFALSEQMKTELRTFQNGDGVATQTIRTRGPGTDEGSLAGIEGSK